MRTLSKKFAYQLLACTPAFCCQFLLGGGWGWIAPTLQKLQSPDSAFTITVEEAAWLGSINEGGRIVGPFVSPFFLDRMGRRQTLVLSSALNVLIWTAVVFCQNVHILLAIRFVFGLVQGVNDVTASIYITEVCSPELRGLGGSGILLTAMAGLIGGNFLTTYLSFANAAIVIAVFAVITVGVQYLGVETPYFLVMKGKYEQARQNLGWLRNNPDNENELSQIQRNVEEENNKKESLKILLTDSTNLRAIFVAVGFFFLFSSVGLHTIPPFASLIFSPSKLLTTNEFTILYSVLASLGGIFSLFIVEKIDRRPFIIYSFLMIFGCNIAVGILVHLRSNGNYDTENEFYPWILFLSISLAGFIGVLVSPAVYVLIGEILPLSVRAIGGSMAVAASSLGSFVSSLLFWPITSRFGMEANFLVYTVMSVLVIIFVYTSVPETRGKSLYDMHTKSAHVETLVSTEGIQSKL